MICGEGARVVDGECVPIGEPLICGEGTREMDGACVPNDVPLVCGEGTRAQEGACVPNDAPLICGEGTHRVEGECVPLDEPLICGEGTHAQDGLCMPDNLVLPCADGTIPRNDTCVAAATQFIPLPFPDRQVVRIGQGIHGGFSHSDQSVFSVDFPLPEGTPVVAVRAGTVQRAKGDSDHGCADPSCNDDANVIVIDHGDGTLAHYVHLQHEGVFVTEGATVCAGTYIGLTGNTGYTTGPHLHFAVVDLFHQTLPLRFDELAAISDGVPMPGIDLTSENREPEQCDQEPRWSDCSRDAFLHYGVEIDPGLPCSVIFVNHHYPVSGRVLSGTGRLFIAQFGQLSRQWTHRCLDTDEDGAFATVVTWPISHQIYTHIMLSAAPEDVCRPLYGWDRAPYIVVQ